MLRAADEAEATLVELEERQVRAGLSGVTRMVDAIEGASKGAQAAHVAAIAREGARLLRIAARHPATRPGVGRRLLAWLASGAIVR